MDLSDSAQARGPPGRTAARSSCATSRRTATSSSTCSSRALEQAPRRQALGQGRSPAARREARRRPEPADGRRTRTRRRSSTCSERPAPSRRSGRRPSTAPRRRTTRRRSSSTKAAASSAAVAADDPKLIDSGRAPSVPVDVWIGDDGLVRKRVSIDDMTVAGQSARSKLTVDISDYGTPRHGDRAAVRPGLRRHGPRSRRRSRRRARRRFDPSAQLAKRSNLIASCSRSGRHARRSGSTIGVRGTSSAARASARPRRRAGFGTRAPCSRVRRRRGSDRRRGGGSSRGSARC